MNDGSAVVISAVVTDSLATVGIRASASKSFDPEKFTHIEYNGPPDPHLPTVLKQQCFTVNRRPLERFVESLLFCGQCGRYRFISSQHCRADCDQNLDHDLFRGVHAR